MKTKNFIKIVTVSIVGILFSTVLNASTTYAIKMTNIMDKTGNTVGTVTPGTKLDVIKKSGKKSKVSVNGWSAFGAETVIFKQVGKRIILGILDESVISKVKKGKSKTDEFESIWNQTSFTGWVKTSSLTDSKEKIWDKADNLFKQRCGGCHQPHPPHEFTANQWPNIVKAMKDRAGLTSDDQWLLTKFMQEHAKDMK